MRSVDNDNTVRITDTIPSVKRIKIFQSVVRNVKHRAGSGWDEVTQGNKRRVGATALHTCYDRATLVKVVAGGEGTLMIFHAVVIGPLRWGGGGGRRSQDRNCHPCSMIFLHKKI